ncbi:hypothetical protein EYF88_10810 [Paracoccus sediminis]|jgi:hypothetical protein|uniref:Uncharacterized protein n=1 Tax=Paracoccus sediminis TaxID=1214787 RepID=A0A238WWW7_9RHOB|nr:hypothetical protein [Paracoccus sediminis]TBN50102.1 hypothetical protein EYF88_10810 [Paracoccus sediminis]SNR51115.1 hypothetical protein SAMN06265378_106176 [Paracoccus sediminis]
MTITHTLSLAVRFIDHFSGRPVPQELPVRLSESYARPAPRPDGSGARQADGSYRFLGAAAGTRRILWRDPFRRSQSGWIRWEIADPEVTLPLPVPAQVIDQELWPTAGAETTPGATGVRGKLRGTGAGGLEIRIALQGRPFNRLTRSDPAGEFLFLPPGVLPLDAGGRVPLTIEARIPGGAVRPILSGSFLPATAGAGFAGPDFTILPQTVARVTFQLA